MPDRTAPQALRPSHQLALHCRHRRTRPTDL